MPDVGSYQFRGNDNATPNTTSWKPPVYVKAHDGSVGVTSDASTWKYAKSVYYHDGADWVEVWNARPELTSTSIYFASNNSTTINFSGSADPNNFSTTAKFEYREVGTSTWNSSSTTSTGMGDGVDGAVSFNATATVADGYKNWEARASATNIVGTDVGTTITKDCRKTGTPSWSATFVSSSVVTCSTCSECGTNTRIDVTYNYTKSGCPDYTAVTTGTCSNGCGTYQPKIGDFTQDGITYGYTGTPGYYQVFPNPYCSSGCDFSVVDYYVTSCTVNSSLNDITITNNPGCVNIFGDPC